MVVTTVGVLGVGRVGSAIARRAIAAGYRVVVAASGDPAKISLLVEVVIPGATALRAADVVEQADIVVIAVPFNRFPGVPLADLDGKVVVDVMNHWEPIDGSLPEFARGGATTSEVVKGLASGARLVKTLNHIGYHELEENALPAGAEGRQALAIAGDDAAAKRQIADFIDRIGYDVVDIGSLAEGRHLQPGGALFGEHFTADEVRRAVGLRSAEMAA
jgi:predicted dinucleotide-binding enzyme